MIAEVLTLYLRGARLGEPRLAERGVVGDMESRRLRHRTVLAFTMTPKLKPVTLKLYEPRLAMVDMTGIYLDGHELIEDVFYRQCWRIRPAGMDATGAISRAAGTSALPGSRSPLLARSGKP